MPHDPIRLADTRGWFLKAKEDLRGAEIDLAAVPPLLGDILFHCQQAVEKALKAFLTWHDHPFRKTHDLVEIGSNCMEFDSTLEPLLRRAAPLTEYAWKFRYPGDASAPTQTEAEESFKLAGEVVKAVFSRLPAEVRP
ncbi:MAG: HEPN domain-containing protein [Candidatus Latescibacteria bacterium]|nr:HEPN domain-containing protein [Candidatus Latescibacterota bacterium]